MNDARRKILNKVITLLGEAKSYLDEVAQEERNSYDNLPESMQQGDKGQALEVSADALEEASNEIDTAISNIETGMD